MFQFLFCYILERKDKKKFKCDIIVLISFLILFVLISFLVNIGKEMSLPGFRTFALIISDLQGYLKAHLSFFQNKCRNKYKNSSLFEDKNFYMLVVLLFLILWFILKACEGIGVFSRFLATYMTPYVPNTPLAIWSV